jgi:hypothetical protein
VDVKATETAHEDKSSAAAAVTEFEGLRKLRQNTQKKKVRDLKKMEINKRAPERETKP